MAGGKAKVPEYPRPVSPVSAEEYPICDNTIVYDEGDVDDFEASSEQRAAKRRRIESYAAAYLRGQPLFILSAQLKGPFDNGWQNPWRRKRRLGQNGEKERAQWEVPETTIKPQPRVADTLPRGSRLPAAGLTPTYPVQQTMKHNVLVSTTDVATSTIPINQSTPTRAAGTSDLKNQRVEDWLKTNEKSSPTEEYPSQPSPIPLARPTRNRTKKWESPVIEFVHPPVPDTLLNLAPVPILQPPNAPEDGTNLATTKRQGAHPQQVMSMAADVAQQTLDAGSYLPQYTSPAVGPRPTTAPSNGSRAEDAILALKRRSLHTIPPSSHLPAFEYRRAFTKDNVQDTGAALEVESPHDPFVVQTAVLNAPVSAAMNDNVQTDYIDPSESLHTAKERASPGLVENRIPSPSKTYSRASTLHDIPSAQMPIQIALESAPSNMSGTGAMLEEPGQFVVPGIDQSTVERAISAVTEVPQRDPPSQSLVAPKPKLSLNQHTLIPRVQQPISPHVEKTPRVDPMWPSDTQEMIESITPFAFSTFKKQKKTTGIQNNPTPQTATKMRRTSKGKRTSFAPEETSSASSRGSLKAIMRVAKSPKPNLDHTSCLKATWEGEDEDEDENSVHSIHRVPSTTPNIPLAEIATKNGTPRGILKSSSNPSAPGLTLGTHKTSSSIKQDAQRVRALDMIEDDMEATQDDFDVDAVMDDLGSYLGTWDPEKEAMALGRASG